MSDKPPESVTIGGFALANNYRGGDLTFATGEGGIRLDGEPADHGDLIFKIGGSTNGEEVLRFRGDGAVFVRGEKVDDNQEIYRAVRLWFEAAIGGFRR